MLAFVVLVIIFFIFSPWFLAEGTLSSGDWPYLFLENIKEFSFFPQSDFLWLAVYYQIPTKILVQYLGISWEAVERLLWFWPFLILAIFSSYQLTKSWIGVLIYTTNTYILMVVSGGQMGIALAYGMAPFVLGRFIKVIQNSEFRIQNSMFVGLILAILTMFDPRISYITITAVVIYILLNLKKNINLYFLLHTFLIPMLVMVFINLYWIMPLLSGNLPKEYQGLGSVEGFEFLSFADFSHALSLLHPNWTENIFGKTYFLQPEFLLLPILAFSALLFLSNIKNQKHPRVVSYSPRGWNILTPREILFYGSLGLLGAFLAKGSNPPFGEANIFLFEHFPGMSMFRDSTKFYLLIVLSYSVLIPFSIHSFSQSFSSKLQLKIQNLLPLLFIGFWLILIYPAVFGQLTGTFKSRGIPDEYIELKQYLISQPQYSRSLWIPSRQRFGFSSNLHLGVSAFDILGSSDSLQIAKVISSDKDKVIYNKLKEMKIKQIIVPYDSAKELFILDRKYSNSLRDRVVTQLDKTEWLIKIPKFSDIAIYKVE